MIQRRGFLAGMLALGVSPAIVRASSLMTVKVSNLVETGGGWMCYEECSMIVINKRALALHANTGDIWIGSMTGKTHFRSVVRVWTPQD